jgi:APA family basic amino acid/polyamine antiporter
VKPEPANSGPPNQHSIADAAQESSTRDAAPTLARRLGLFDITMLVMGSVIGSGIFAVPHVVAGLLPNPLLVLSAWALGGLVTLSGSFVYAELARRRPHVGGQYAFLREAYHPLLAFLYGWSLLWIVQSGGMAFVAVIFSDYFIELLRALGDWLAQSAYLGFLAPPFTKFAGMSAANFVVTTLAIGALTVVNCFGVRAAGTTQNIFMILKIAAILMLVICGLLLVDGQWPITDGVPGTGLHVAEAPGELGPSGGHLIALFGAAMVPVFFAYGGSHTTTFIAGEVTEPRRNLPRGLVMGICGVIALYLAVNFVCLRVLGIEELAATKTPASYVMKFALGNKGEAIISAGIAISAVGFLSQAMLTSPRVYYAMAKDGLFFKSVAFIHPRTRVPVVAIAIQGIFAAVIAVSGTYRQILNYVMSVELGFFALTGLSLLIIRRRDANHADSAKLSMPGHPMTTLLFVVVNVAVLLALFNTSPLNSAIGIGIASLGVPVYFFWRSRRDKFVPNR